MPPLLDVQRCRLLEEPPGAAPDGWLECDLLVVGGGMGGCAAALAACRAGRTVVLTEETDWLGGQMTSQGVSALDEHPYIERFGGTRSYYELRALIREFYREEAVLSPSARMEAALNPGRGWVSRLCFEPRAGVWALDRLLAPHEADGHLTRLLRHRAVSARLEGDVVASVTLRHLDSERRVGVSAPFVLDATELGDLLPLVEAPYVWGAESAAETGEPSALPEARPDWVQSFTYPFALEYRPGEQHYLPLPEAYARDRERQPYTLRHWYEDDRGWVTYRMFSDAPGAGGPFWTYRRLLDSRQFEDAYRPRDVAMINWPGNDYRHGGILEVPAPAALAALRAARDLSLGFCAWLQRECPRDEGGAGYPELLLRPDVMGTADGLSKYPYIRESRRLRALRTVTETDISAAWQPGARARLFPDSVGLGLYAIDIHPTEGEEKLPPAPARPFQIPLGALLPGRPANLLAAGKNIGTTHVTNGAYRLHPVEWNIGESAALTAVFCLDRGLTPAAVLGDARRLRRLQRRLLTAGVPLHWFVDVPLDHPAFEAVQALGAWGLGTGTPEHLELRPDEPAGAPELRALLQAPAWARERLEPLLLHALPGWSGLSRAACAGAVYEALRV